MKNTFYIIGAGIAWGMIAVFIRIFNKIGFSAMECVAIRALLAALLLLFYLLVTDRKKLYIRLQDLGYFFGTGICSIVFFNYCYFEAIERIGGSSIPALLLYTAPIFVMILSAIFFHEQFTLRKGVALGITFLGLGFVTGAFTGQESLSLITFLLGIGSGLGYALYSIFGKFVVEKYDAVTITFYTFVMATIGAVPLSGILNDVPRLFRIDTLSAGLGLAFFSTVLPFLLYTKGLRGIEAGKASVLATVEPFVATLVGVFVFHEVFTAAKLIGMLLIVIAILYLNWVPRKKLK